MTEPIYRGPTANWENPGGVYRYSHIVPPLPVPTGTPVVVLTADQYESLTGIVQRMTSSEWWLGPPDHSAYPNQWVPLKENRMRDWTREPEPLTAAEQLAIYGSVVRKEETSDG